MSQNCKNIQCLIHVWLVAAARTHHKARTVTSSQGMSVAEVPVAVLAVRQRWGGGALVRVILLQGSFHEAVCLHRRYEQRAASRDRP